MSRAHGKHSFTKSITASKHFQFMHCCRFSKPGVYNGNNATQTLTLSQRIEGKPWDTDVKAEVKSKLTFFSIFLNF